MTYLEIYKKYTGDWKNGKSHGSGTFTYADGAVYVGEFDDGKVQGAGRLTFSDGKQSYTGEFADGKRDGQGAFTSSNGARIVGKWKGDKIWKGKEFSPTGKVVAFYVNGIRSK